MSPGIGEVIAAAVKGHAKKVNDRKRDAWGKLTRFAVSVFRKAYLLGQTVPRIVDWLGLRLSLILVLVVVAFSVLQPFLWKWFLLTDPPQESTNLSRLMAPTITVVAFAIAGLGVLAYHYLRTCLETLMATTIKQREDALGLQVHTKISYVCWDQYKLWQCRAFDEEVPDYYKGSVEGAIDAAREALESARRLKGQADEKVYESLICTCENNLAYHLATRRNKNDVPEALQYASHIFERAPVYGKYHHWRETYAWVQARFGESDLERCQAKRVIMELTNDPDVPAAWREQIKKKYTCLGLLEGIAAVQADAHLPDPHASATEV